MAIKIMWLCNTLIPDAAVKLGVMGSKPEIWLTGMYAKLMNCPDMELIYLFSQAGQKKFGLAS